MVIQSHINILGLLLFKITFYAPFEKLNRPLNFFVPVTDGIKIYFYMELLIIKRL